MQSYILKHSPITSAYFSKNSKDFMVDEIKAYDFSGDGEHLILHIRKKDLTTWDMLKILSAHCGAKMRDFGYAGLKDKHGLTIQYISIHKSYEKAFNNFSHPNIKILNQTYHQNKLKIGHLKANRFFIRLKKISSIDAKKLIDGLEFLNLHGYPNHFGYQRFGIEQKNAEDGLKILKGELKFKNKKMHQFLLSAYQSELFNKWLDRRIEISHLVESFSINELEKILPFSHENIKNLKNQKQFLKILKGDIMHHYPHGKAFLCEDLQSEIERFSNKQTTLTGFLLGSRAMKSENDARIIDDEIFDYSFENQLTGSRRFAWSFLDDLAYKYIEENAWFEMNFTLQKGSYATTILKQLLKKD